MHKSYSLTVSVDIKIPFFDVDPMYITWHGHYLKYFEIARCALLEKIDFDYNQMTSSGYAWPIVDMRVKYIKPTRFNQDIIVTASLDEYENRLKIDYVIHDKLTQQKLTAGYTIQVAVDQTNSELCYVSPSILIDKIKDYI
jgi:acyl-CoA thioester hydrolase